MKSLVIAVLIALVLYVSTANTRSVSLSGLERRGSQPDGKGSSLVLFDAVPLLVRGPAPAPVEPAPARPEPAPEPAPGGEPAPAAPPANVPEYPANRILLPRDQAVSIPAPDVRLEKVYKEAVAWLTQKLDNNGPRLGRNQAMFYAARDLQEQPRIEETAKQYGHDHGVQLLHDVQEKFMQAHDYQPLANDKEAKRLFDEFTDITCAAFGRASFGRVTIMCDKAGIVPGSRLAKLEWPELMMNGRVTEITWVNVDDWKDTRVIWSWQFDPRIACPTGVPMHKIGKAPQ